MDQLTALLATLAVEAPLAAACAGDGPRRRLSAGLTAIGGSLVTHPVVWLVALRCYAHLPVPVCLLGVELFAVAAEACAYAWVARLPWRRALLVSLLANAASCGVGLLTW